MHPLCCITLESPGFGNNSPEIEAVSLSRTRSVPAGGSYGNAGEGSEATVAGVLYKWTNYGKGWRSRWFRLRNGVLSYAKIRHPENLNLLSPADDLRLIGQISNLRLSRIEGSTTMRRKHHKTSGGVVHLKMLLVAVKKEKNERGLDARAVMGKPDGLSHCSMGYVVCAGVTFVLSLIWDFNFENFNFLNSYSFKFNWLLM
ncbi:hypothetical protein RIF29_36785 [Crotalaria pallida]|uniref:PH domain-containing protein n=1 Tax=Crotalaria pallida TaxID=3830 RepID=A0AAN9EBV8_CROPI